MNCISHACSLLGAKSLVKWFLTVQSQHHDSLFEYRMSIWLFLFVTLFIIFFCFPVYFRYFCSVCFKYDCPFHYKCKAFSLSPPTRYFRCCSFFSFRRSRLFYFLLFMSGVVVTFPVYFRCSCFFLVSCTLDFSWCFLCLERVLKVLFIHMVSPLLILPLPQNLLPQPS